MQEVFVDSLQVLPWNATALLLASFFISVFYMIFKFLNDPQKIAFLKIELYELFVTGIILILIFSFWNIFSMPASSFIPGAKGDIRGYSLDQLDKFISKSYMASGVIYSFYTAFSIFSSIKVNAQPLGLGFSSKPFSFLRNPLNTLALWEVVLVIGDITVMAQAHILNFSTILFLKYLLPFGIFLRCFTPTRRFGGTIIALAIVFSFLFPILISITYTMANSMTFTDSDISSLIEYAKNANSKNNFYEGTGNLVNKILEVIAGIVLGAVVFPLVNGLILITSAASLSAALGEPVDISNLTRMI